MEQLLAGAGSRGPARAVDEHASRIDSVRDMTSPAFIMATSEIGGIWRFSPSIIGTAAVVMKCARAFIMYLSYATS